MTSRKTLLNYILWAVYSVIIGGAFVIALNDYWALQLHPFVMLGVVCGFMAIWALMRFIIVKIIKKQAGEEPGNKIIAGICEFMRVLLALAGGVAAYYYFFTQGNFTYVDDSDFIWESLVGEGFTLMPDTYNADSLFTLLIKILFIVVGNKTIAVIGLQLAIQLITGLFLYGAVRKVAGDKAATFVLWGFTGVYVFFSMSGEPASIWLMLLIFAIGLSFFAALFRKEEDLKDYSKGEKVLQYIWLVVLGIYTINLIYLDFYGIGLLMFGIGILCASDIGKDKEEWSLPDKRLQILFVVVGLIIGFILIVLIQMLQKQLFIDAVIVDWLYEYIIGLDVIWLGVLLLVTSAIGVCLYIVPADADETGVDATVAEEKEEKPKKSKWFKKANKTDKTEMIDKSEEFEKIEEETPSTVTLLENPLPGPKKHVPKTMDYDINDVKPQLMKYDINVKDDDDFDLK